MLTSFLSSNDETVKLAKELIFGHHQFVKRNTGETTDPKVDLYLQNNEGILSNNRHFIAESRMLAQPNGDGTTEGQSLHILGYCYAYLVTQNEEYLNAAKAHWDAYVQYFYVNQAIPTDPSRWICNWICNSKNPFLAHFPINPDAPTGSGYKGVPIEFTNGLGKIDQGTPFWGEYLDIATYAHRGHGAWAAINATVQEIKSTVDWTQVFAHRITTMPTDPTARTAWVDWDTLLGANVYSPNWDQEATTYPVDWIIIWNGDKVSEDGIIDTGHDASEIGTVQLKDTTITGTYLLNYGVKLPVDKGGYEIGRNEVYHNRPLAIPLQGSPLLLGNASDAEQWFADSCYLLWKLTNDTKYYNALRSSLNTIYEYTFIDTYDCFFRKTEEGDSVDTDGISYEFIYPDTANVTYSRTNKGYIQIVTDVSAQVALEQQAVIYKVKNDSKVRTTVGGTDTSNLALTAEIRVTFGQAKHDTDGLIFQHVLPYNNANLVKSFDIGLTDFVRATKEDGSTYLLADLKAVTDYSGLVWTGEYDTNVFDGRTAYYLNAFFPDDDAGGIVGNWLLDSGKAPLTSIIYKADADMNIRIEDDNKWRWYWLLPATNGQWVEFQLKPEDLTLSGYQPDQEDGATEPTSATYTEIDQFTVLLDASGTNKNFSYYCVNDAPPKYDISTDGIYTLKYRLTLSAANPMTAYVGDCKVINPAEDNLAYCPGVIPFSNIYEYGSPEFSAWHGMPYPGYQYPWIYVLDPGDKGDRLTNMVNFLYDAQQAYKTTVGELGPVAPSYIWDRWDNTSYGSPDTFSMYQWGDDVAWAGYQSRSFMGACRAAQEMTYRGMAIPEKLTTFITNWIDWLIHFVTTYDDAIPTEFPALTPSVPVEDDFTGHMTGLWLGGCAMAYEIGIRPEGIWRVMNACVKDLHKNFGRTEIPNHPMNGAFSPFLGLPGLNGIEYGFYTGEIFRGLSMYIHISTGGTQLYPVTANEVPVAISVPTDTTPSDEAPVAS